MAILITVYQCDLCPELASLKTDADWLVFEENWWEGFKCQFCPKCRGTVAAKLLMLEDAEIILGIAKRFEEKENSQNAEFVN